MVLSYLDYGSMFLSVRTIEDISTIQVLQNKAVRSCLRVKNYVDVPTHELPVFEINVSPSAQADYFWSGLTKNLKNRYQSARGVDYFSWGP